MWSFLVIAKLGDTLFPVWNREMFKMRGFRTEKHAFPNGNSHFCHLVGFHGNLFFALCRRIQKIG